MNMVLLVVNVEGICFMIFGYQKVQKEPKYFFKGTPVYYKDNWNPFWYITYLYINIQVWKIRATLYGSSYRMTSKLISSTYFFTYLDFLHLHFWSVKDEIIT